MFLVDNKAIGHVRDCDIVKQFVSSPTVVALLVQHSYT